MADVPLFALDASAILKVYFQEEPGSQEALDLMADYITGRVNLIAHTSFLMKQRTSSEATCWQDGLPNLWDSASLLIFLLIEYR